MRRPKGKKLQFIIAGPSLEDAPNFINWKNITAAGAVVEWHGADGQIVILKPRSN